jgi:ABC-2 type transport system ATP-binding protein
MTAPMPALPPVGAPLLTLDRVCKSYGDKRAVHDISLEVPRGSIYGFLGPNGSGKTTTIRCIMSIILPDSGAIRLGGRPLEPNLRDRIGYLPEERGLYRKMKCLDQLVFLARLKGVPRAEARRRAVGWLDRLGLGDYAERKVDNLSKGMQQKIQFAATFISEPDLVILDEVFSGLDPLNIELLRDIIVEQKSRGTTILFSTHMLAEAERICDAICLIEGGQKILDGSLPEVRAAFPLRAVRVAWDGEVSPPADLPGVTQQEFHEGSWRLLLEDGADPRALLPRLQAAGPLTLFAANRPTLSEIFLTAVRRRRQEATA